MVFNNQTTRENIFRSVTSNKIIEGQSIQSFGGHLMAEGSNILNYEFGQLLYNKNMEWRYSGSSKFLRTKRGSTLYLDITLTSKGAGVFLKETVEYIFWVDTDGNLKYRDNAGQDQILKSGLDTTYRHEFWYYGLNSNETLYGCNRNDGIYKITLPGASFVYTSVITTGAWSMSFSNISGRMFFVNGHVAYYGGVQNQTALDTSNLEDFNITRQSLLVRPDQGEGIQRIIEDGEITFYFKDTGIWALINAEEEIDNWAQPQCNADVGTKSPETVAYSKYGKGKVFIYLGTDKTLRLFTARVERNSGVTPTLSGGESLTISNPFQKLLDDIPDGQLKNCNGFFFNGYYILNIVSSNAEDIDTTIIIDTDKLMGVNDQNDVSQPYWFYTDNMEFKNYVVLSNQKLYGIHKSGYISQIFADNIYYEEVPDRITPVQDFRDFITISGVVGTFRKRETITGSVSSNTATTTIDISDSDLTVKNSVASWNVGETITGSISGATAVIVSVTRRVAIEWAAYTGWHKYSARELRLYDAYLNYNVEGRWNINFTVNSFIFGESIPQYDEGNSYSLRPQISGGAFFDYDFFNQAYFDVGVGQLSQNTGGEGRGHYFSFGFYSSNYGEWATIYSIEPRFETIKDDSIGKNY